MDPSASEIPEVYVAYKLVSSFAYREAAAHQAAHEWHRSVAAQSAAALQLQRTQAAQRGESAVAAQKEALANAHVEDIAVLSLTIDARRAELTALQERLQKVRPLFKEDHIAASLSWQVRRVDVACKSRIITSCQQMSGGPVCTTPSVCALTGHSSRSYRSRLSLQTVLDCV